MGPVDFYVFLFMLAAGQRPIILFYSVEDAIECASTQEQMKFTYPTAVIVDCAPIYKTERAKRPSVKRKTARKR